MPWRLTDREMDRSVDGCTQRMCDRDEEINEAFTFPEGLRQSRRHLPIMSRFECIVDVKWNQTTTKQDHRASVFDWFLEYLPPPPPPPPIFCVPLSPGFRHEGQIVRLSWSAAPGQWRNGHFVIYHSNTINNNKSLVLLHSVLLSSKVRRRGRCVCRIPGFLLFLFLVLQESSWNGKGIELSHHKHDMQRDRRAFLLWRWKYLWSLFRIMTLLWFWWLGKGKTRRDDKLQTNKTNKPWMDGWTDGQRNKKTNEMTPKRKKKKRKNLLIVFSSSRFAREKKKGYTQEIIKKCLSGKKKKHCSILFLSVLFDISSSFLCLRIFLSSFFLSFFHPTAQQQRRGGKEKKE